jgi:hypothetical protein
VQQKNRLYEFSSELNSLLYVVLAATVPNQCGRDEVYNVKRDVCSRHSHYVYQNDVEPVLVLALRAFRLALQLADWRKATDCPCDVFGLFLKWKLPYMYPHFSAKQKGESVYASVILDQIAFPEIR